MIMGDLGGRLGGTWWLMGRGGGWEIRRSSSLPVCTLGQTVVLFTAGITGEEGVEERRGAHFGPAWSSRQSDSWGCRPGGDLQPVMEEPWVWRECGLGDRST